MVLFKKEKLGLNLVVSNLHPLGIHITSDIERRVCYYIENVFAMFSNCLQSCYQAVFCSVSFFLYHCHSFRACLSCCRVRLPVFLSSVCASALCSRVLCCFAGMFLQYSGVLPFCTIVLLSCCFSVLPCIMLP